MPVARRNVLAALLLLLACGGALAAAAPTGGQQPAYQLVPGNVIVKMRPGMVSVMDEDSHGVKYSRGAGLPNAAVYKITDGKSVDQKVKEMRDNPAIEFVEPDYRVPVNWLPNDSLFKAQWHHTTIGSQVAWNSSKGSAEIKVCHLDSGVRVDHPDLVGRVLTGWNLVPEVQEFDQETAPPGSAHYKNTNDTYGHGTHTAGIIAAVGNNGLGVAGIAMDVKLLVCKFIWDDGFGSISDALECLRLCREEGATISSNSWGGVPHSQAIEEALVEMEHAGMLFVVASGNQGVDLDRKPTFPASSGMESMIVVGASGREDRAAAFSNIGKRTVHLLAPGEQILSTTSNGWYAPMDGTSMATPLVSGAAALLQSAALGAGVHLSAGDTKRLLLGTADATEGGHGRTITGGRLNVGAAMAALSLLLHERGLPALPGTSLEDAALEEVQRQLLGNSWGQELLNGDGGLAAKDIVAAAAVAPAASPEGAPQQEPQQDEVEADSLQALTVRVGVAAQQQQQQQQQRRQAAVGGTRPRRHHPKLKQVVPFAG